MWGSENRRIPMSERSEVSLRAINNSDGNPIFLGRAKVDTTESFPKWQIRKITYDSNQAVTSILWPQNNEGNASTEYEFIWSDTTNLTITGISRANPAVVTVSSIGDLQNGDLIIIQDVVGMTEVNFDGTNIYTVANIAGATFELSGVNSSAYTIYGSGGTVNFSNVINLTYS